MAVDSDVPPIIAAHLNYLLSHSPFRIKVDQMWSASNNSAWVDHFTLSIPFCLDYIQWDIMFDVESPLSAPDVIFGTDDDKFPPFLLSVNDPTKSPLSTISNWNSRDPSKLLSLILQLRDMYSAYQKKRVEKVDDVRVKFEISTMVAREICRIAFVDYRMKNNNIFFTFQGIEMSLSSNVEQPEEVKFAVPLLEVDLNNLVPACPWKLPQKIYLQVIYPIGRNYQTAPSPPRLKLVSTPELRSLFSVEEVKLPPWMDGMCMAEYIPVLEQVLQKQMSEAVSLIGFRRKLIEALPPFFGRPLEADAVHFLIPVHFPKQQPTLILQSSQHFNTQGLPIKSSPLSEYPWSPRWELSEMASRIL
ncbi:hypothetical protein KSS87_016418 [Heliosperma pusillum]|nr:hypothetical protein KSS87_016418 [Heliosperma pusillum]